MTRPRRAAVYARLSVTAEESVSIARQVEACERYAAARGWEVVLVASDDGVSATKHRPQDRPGWASLLASEDRFQAVIVWKVDRLARRVLDFLNADAALQERGAALVAVEDPIDLTTAQGRAFATMLAVFGEMEAAAISARVKGARAHLVREGRAVGNRPWPFESVPNPAGPGLVWRPIPERAEAVREASRRLQAGEVSLRALAREWSARWPSPTGGSWSGQSVAGLLRSPVLTGASLHHGEPVRNPDGTIRRDPAREILSPADHRALLAVFDSRKRTGPTPETERPLLYGLAFCGSCDARLVTRWNRSTPGRPAYYRCASRDCAAPVTAVLDVLDAYVVSVFLEKAPERPVEAWDALPSSTSSEWLADLHEALSSVQDALAATEDDDEAARLLERRKTLRSAIREAEETVTSERRLTPGVSLLDVWDAATTTDEARTALAGLIERVEVRRTSARTASKVSDRVEVVTK